MSNRDKNLNIHQRINLVMEQVEYIQKVDKAAKGLPYKFITHDQVTGALHLPMVKAGMNAYTTVLELVQDGNRTRAKVQVRFQNIDDPEDFVDTIGYGYGIDQQDKGPGKAISYATKMCYLKNFMLETGEDPEKDNIDYEGDKKEDEVQEMNELLVQLPHEKVVNFYNVLQVKDLRDLPKDKIAGAKAYLKKQVEEMSKKGGNK